MEKNTTEKKSLLGRLKKMVHKEVEPVKMEEVSTVMTPPTSFGITIPAGPEAIREVVHVTKELSDDDIKNRLADVAEKIQEDRKERKVSMSELMKVPGDGSNYTAPKPSKASIEQKRQKAARRLARKNRK